MALVDIKTFLRTVFSKHRFVVKSEKHVRHAKQQHYCLEVRTFSPQPHLKLHSKRKELVNISWLTHRPFLFRPTLYFRFGFLLIGIPLRDTGRRAAELGCPSAFSSVGACHRSARLCAPPRSQQHCADSSMSVTQLRFTRSSASGRPRCAAGLVVHAEWALRHYLRQMSRWLRTLRL